MAFDLDELKKLSEEEQNKILNYLQNDKRHEVYENNLKMIEENRKYIGKCFKNKIKDEYLIVVDSRSINEYHLECFSFSFPIKIEKTFPYMTKMFNPNSCFGGLEMDNFDFKNAGLLCYSFKETGIRMNAEFEEITEEEFIKQYNNFTSQFLVELSNLIATNRGEKND